MLGKLFSYDDTLFFLPALSGIAKSRVDLDKIAHCSFTENVVQFYKTHPGVLMSSKSLSKVSSIRNKGAYLGITFQSIVDQPPVKTLVVSSFSPKLLRETVGKIQKYVF